MIKNLEITDNFLQSVQKLEAIEGEASADSRSSCTASQPEAFIYNERKL